jgi:hypothetical protein
VLQNVPIRQVRELGHILADEIACLCAVLLGKGDRRVDATKLVKKCRRAQPHPIGVVQRKVGVKQQLIKDGGNLSPRVAKQATLWRAK